MIHFCYCRIKLLLFCSCVVSADLKSSFKQAPMPSSPVLYSVTIRAEDDPGSDPLTVHMSAFLFKSVTFLFLLCFSCLHCPNMLLHACTSTFYPWKASVFHSANDLVTMFSLCRSKLLNHRSISLLLFYCVKWQARILCCDFTVHLLQLCPAICSVSDFFFLCILHLFFFPSFFSSGEHSLLHCMTSTDAVALKGRV